MQRILPHADKDKQFHFIAIPCQRWETKSSLTSLLILLANAHCSVTVGHYLKWLLSVKLLLLEGFPNYCSDYHVHTCDLVTLPMWTLS